MAYDPTSHPRGWTEYDMQAKYDLNHHPQVVKDELMRQKPPRRGVIRALGFVAKTALIGLFLAIVLGFIRGALGG